MHFTTTLSYDDKTVDLPFGKMSSFDELYVDFRIEQKNNATRIQLMIHPKKPVILKGLKLESPRSFEGHEKIFCNGFQSWSESREYQLDEKIPKLSSLAHSYLKYYGDAHFDFIKRGKDYFHSWTYGYIKKGNKIDFIGSLNEQTAFTLIQYDQQQGKVTIEKECKDLALEHSFPILDIFVTKANETWVFNEYFNAMNLPPRSAPSISGWSSWHTYKNKISEEIILKNVIAFKEKEAAIDIIQIDEGYQNHIGDWLNIKNTFPNGMAKVAQEIKSKGFKAGLWIAPFICEKKSDIFQNKKHWLVKNADGSYVKAGYHSHWGGSFYALNFYHKEVQDYLLGVFKIILEKWGFDLVKLDFLFAACIQPPANKTRGQMMNDALQFLRTTVGNKWISGSGVPLGSAFGKLDYCRVSSDIHLKWEHSMFKLAGHRERVSTIAGLRSILGRWQLNGKVFQSDPDVFLLRDKNSHLNSNQQYTILIIKTLLGGLAFTSDYIGDYSEEQWAEFQQIYNWRNSAIQSVEQIADDVYLIRFKNEGQAWACICNLQKKAKKISFDKTMIELEAFESMVLKA